MKDLAKLKDICLQEVIDAGITPGKIRSWKVNTRARTRWGMCTRDNRTGEYSIQIAYRLLADSRVSVKACKTTIIHEILHTCDGCMRHTGLWKVYADRMNRMYGYDIKRETSGEEKGVENHISKPMPVRYKYICRYCGQVVQKKRACKFTHYYRNYTCGLCGFPRAFYKVEE